MTFDAYVVVFEGKYLRFGSYSKATTVDNPLKATLYSRLKDAKRRTLGTETYWIDGQNREVPGKTLNIKFLQLKMVEERDAW